MRRIPSVLVVAVLLTVHPAPAAGLDPILDPPVDGALLVAFHAPVPYGPGHRGVDLAAAPGTPVRASAAGRVTFAGVVVGLRWVTVDHGTLRTTVGPLGRIDVARGQLIGRGQVLGTSDRAHGLEAVHWSARRGDTYVDPTTARPRLASLVADRSGPSGRRRQVPPGVR